MDLDRAVEALRKGKIVGLPTDTVYGLAADPFQQDALEAIFDLKRRPHTKPLPILVASTDQAMEMAIFTDLARSLADTHWPGALTLIVSILDSNPEWIGHSQKRTIGLRCPDHSATLNLLELSGPLAVTSANLNGQPAVLDDREAQSLFGDAVSVYIQGSSFGGVPSTILDLTEPEPSVLRQGPVCVS